MTSRYDEYVWQYINIIEMDFKMRAYLCLFVIVALTLQTINAQRRRRTKNKSVCDNATKKLGIGFNPHPYDCTQFVQCYYLPGRVEPVYRNCEYGQHWDQASLTCVPARLSKCEHDKCKKAGVQYYKHTDPNKCNAYWKCINGKSYGLCCPDGEGFHSQNGCIPMPDCKDMCPLKDRVPGCPRRPISGAPTQFEQYTDNGVWRKEKCPSGAAYNPADCECSLKGLIVPGRKCKPDIKLTFDKGEIRDISGNKYDIQSRAVTVYQDAAYFRGRSSLTIPQLRPSQYDEGVLIIKMKFKEDKRRNRGAGLQAMVTNGHCGKNASVVIAKFRNAVLLGAEANMSRSFPLPIVNKPWKEVIYIKDEYKLEGRVCGASYNNWCTGKVKDTNCGFQIGGAPGMAGFYGMIDDISIYRCKPLDTVININY